MVSTKNKRRLKRAAKKAKKAVKKAAKGSSAAVKNADKAMREAEDVVQNPEPNDVEDVELYRQVQRNHKQVMRMLRRIDNDIDELAKPADEQPGVPSVESGFDWTKEWKL